MCCASASAGTGIYLFPRIAAIIAARMPGTSLEHSVLAGDEMVDALENNRIDVGITTNLNQILLRTGHTPGVEFAAFRCVAYSWAFLASPELARQVAEGRVSSLRVLLPEWVSSGLGRILEMLRPLEMRVSVEVASHTEAAKSAALASQAVAFVPEYTARHEVMSGELTTCLEDLPILDSYVYVGHRRPARHPDIADFIQVIREVRGLMRTLVTVEDSPRVHRLQASGA